MTATPAGSPAAQAPEVITFGCRLNGYESDVMTAHARRAGLDRAVIVNTCAVTAEAERQARQAIRKVRRERPDAEIIVTGCAAAVNPASFAAMPEVSRILPNADKLKPDAFGTAIHAVPAGPAQNRARAFVRVQNGCDHRCTFCIIPYGRGPNRSVPVERVIAETAGLIQQGHAEIVLTGVDMASYGQDLPDRPTVAMLIRQLLHALPALPRLRLSSLDCTVVDEALLDLFATEQRLAPHLHLSLQAGDDLILKRMARRHSRADAIRACADLRQARPGIALGADLIAGFPTETELMFRNSLELVADCGLVWLHVFPYSERPGTPAARIPRQVPGALRRQRAALLRDCGLKAAAAFLQDQVGQVAEVLVEQDTIGRSEHFAPVRLDLPVASGSLVKARITGVADGFLRATPLAVAA